MKFYSIFLFVGFALVALTTVCKNKTKEVKGIGYNNYYFGCPQYPVSTPLNLKSSLIENPEEAANSLNTPPCLMAMIVHQDFMEGYRDNLNGYRARLRNKTQEYVDGYNLAANDIQKGVSRKLESIK